MKQCMRIICAYARRLTAAVRAAIRRYRRTAALNLVRGSSYALGSSAVGVIIWLIQRRL